MTYDQTRVVLLSLDGVNHASVTPEIMPRLWALGQTGGRAPDGGRCDLPSVTYPGHATLLTGRLPHHHGVRTNLAGAPRPGVCPGWAGQPRVTTPTIFDLCHAAGLRTAAVLGDHKLFPIIGAEVADHVWPANGAVPPGTATDPHGYPIQMAVRPHLLAAIADRTIPFVFGHLNETDTWGHRLGPDHPETLSSYTMTDAIVGEVIDALADGWPRTVVIVLSDHGMEPTRNGASIDLRDSVPGRDHVAEVVDEGGAALVRLKLGVDQAAAGTALTGVRGVVGWSALAPDVLLLEAEPGGLFASGFTKSLRGVHGGPGATRTVAVVGGGHPEIPSIAAAMQSRPPHLSDWGPTIAALLGLDLPDPDGRRLIAG